MSFIIVTFKIDYPTGLSVKDNVSGHKDNQTCLIWIVYSQGLALFTDDNTKCQRTEIDKVMSNTQC